MSSYSSFYIQKILDKSKSKYKIGLTATLGRKDKKHVIIPDYISDDIFIAKDENAMKPKVYMLHTDIPLDSNPMLPWGKKINKLVERQDYIDLVVATANIQAEKGHKVLAVSDRVEFLEKCNNISRELDSESEIIVGTTKERKKLLNLLREGFIDIIWGSQKIFSEGISENKLSCLILAQPVNNVHLLEQLCGRVTRKAENKRQPIIIDIILSGITGKNQAASRENFYINKGWEVEKM